MKKGKIMLASLAVVVAISSAYAFKAESKLPRTLFQQTSTDCIPVNCHENPNDGGIPCPVTAYKVDLGKTCQTVASPAFQIVN